LPRTSTAGKTTLTERILFLHRPDPQDRLMCTEGQRPVTDWMEQERERWQSRSLPTATTLLLAAAQSRKAVYRA
jgi:peptide subunit release factor RF-3